MLIGMFVFNVNVDFKTISRTEHECTPLIYTLITVLQSKMLHCYYYETYLLLRQPIFTNTFTTCIMNTI